MTITRPLCAIALPFLLASTPALADDEEITVLPCRPTIACTAEIVPAGTLEVETGVAERRAPGARVDSMQALAKYSITDRVQVQLGSNGIVASGDGTTTSFDGAFGGPKVVLAKQGTYAPAVSISGFIAAPTRAGTAAMTTTTDADVWAYVSKDLGPLHADLNVGVDFLGIDRKVAAQYVSALSLSMNIGAGIGAMLEGYAFVGGAPYADHDAGILSGFTVAVTPRVMFDIGTDVALFRDTRKLTAFAGVTFIPVAKR